MNRGKLLVSLCLEKNSEALKNDSTPPDINQFLNLEDCPIVFAEDNNIEANNESQVEDCAEEIINNEPLQMNDFIVLEEYDNIQSTSDLDVIKNTLLVPTDADNETYTNVQLVPGETENQTEKSDYWVPIGADICTSNTADCADNPQNDDNLPNTTQATSLLSSDCSATGHDQTVGEKIVDINPPVREDVTYGNEEGVTEVPTAIVRPRKRTRNEDLWQRNIIKKKRNSGQTYTSWSGKTVQERSMKPPCSSSCRLNCYLKFTNEERNEIFKRFWEYGDINRQSDFIIHNIDIKPTMRIRLRKRPLSSNSVGDCVDNASDNPETHPRSNSMDSDDIEAPKRAWSYYYSFRKGGIKEKVCQTFFLNTLSVSQQMVKTAVNKADPSHKFVEKDKRGLNHCSRIENSIKLSVRNHIKSFPKFESHYCRKKSSRQYLSPELNVVKMYELYEEYCLTNGIEKKAKLSMYRHIFNTEFNLDFFQPKKDRCDFCEKYRNCEQTQELKEMMLEHEKNKIAARAEKEMIKIKAIQDDTLCGAVFDLQQVLQAPHADVSQLYYKRKLCVYNLSVYDLSSRVGWCYMWPECKGQRGSNEIASCVKAFIDENVRKGKKDFCFFSDNCGGQNLNRNMVSMYIHAAVHHNTNIRHHFLERGHTQNEGDSIHSVIERSAKKIPIYTPGQWYAVVRAARRKNPYKVVEMEDFHDFLKFCKQAFSEMNKHTDGKAVKWQKVRVIKVVAGEEEKVFVKYNYDGDFEPIGLKPKRRRRSLLRSIQLEKAYEQNDPRLTISSRKYDDLVSLCNNFAIPREYHDYFLSLKHDTSRVVDDENIAIDSD